MSEKFKLDKCWSTREFNFSSICADKGDYGYGVEIKDYEMQRECWNIGFHYYSELLRAGIIYENGKVK